MNDKLFLLIFTFIFPTCLFTQVSFLELGKKIVPEKDSLFSFQIQQPSISKCNVLEDSILQINAIFNYLLSKENKNKKDLFQQSLLLTEISHFSMIHAKSLFSSNVKRKWSDENKIKRLMRYSLKSFGLVSIHTFTIPVLKEERQFFYDKNGPDGGYNLYKGKKEDLIKLKEDFVHVPLELYTYEEIASMLKNKMRTSKISKEIQTKRACAFGYYFYLNPKTLYKNKIPTVKCIVILGHKRFEKLKMD
jgi:hypothetical protein